MFPQIRKEFSCSGPGWETNTYLRCGNISLERHFGKCPCSYCERLHWLFEVWMPENKVWNAWRVIAFRTWKSKWYLRWTQKQPKQEYSPSTWCGLCVSSVSHCKYPEHCPYKRTPDGTQPEDWNMPPPSL